MTRLDRFRYATGLASALVVMGVVTALSNTTELLSFLLFPPLAAATYQLFAHPGEASSSPRNLVLGLTSGAIGGWAGVAVARGLFELPAAEPFVVSVPAAILTILFTGVLLWFVDADLAPSFAAGLLVLLLDVSPLIYVLNVAGASLLVAVAFHGWQQIVYDRRAERLFGISSSRGNVLVPVRSAADEAVIRFGARIAASDDAAKLLLARVDDGGGTGDADVSDEELAQLRDSVESEIGVDCEVITDDESGDVALSALSRLAQETNTDLVVVPYETAGDRLAPFIRRLFRGDADVIVTRLSGSRTEWSRILVSVQRAGRIAHSMIEYARQLAGQSGHVSISTCISDERERRAAERMSANLAEAFAGGFETRVANDWVESFLADNGPQYDLVCVGAGTDRAPASRFLSPPTFQRLEDLDADLAIVHRN
ncbi:MAG: HPP family protein [Halopenitus sp.]